MKHLSVHVLRCLRDGPQGALCKGQVEALGGQQGLWEMTQKGTGEIGLYSTFYNLRCFEFDVSFSVIQLSKRRHRCG